MIKIGFLASLVLGPEAPMPQVEKEISLVAVPRESAPAASEAASVSAPLEAAPTPEEKLLAQVEMDSPAPEEIAAKDEKADADSTAKDAPVEDALALASSRTALGTSRLFGSSVAYAADLAPVPPADPVPGARSLQPSASPYVPAAEAARPDEMPVPTPPAPNVRPFVSRDSAAQKEAELTRQEQELLALQQQMEHRMTELHTLEGRIQNMIQEATTTQDGKFKQLVDMYANMKPRQAAAALTTVDEEVAVKILTGMKSKQSGEILSYMDPKHAARLSEVLAKMQM